MASGRLALLSNNLDGSLPPSLFNLTELTLLAFKSNPHLGGSIPSQIGRLTKLDQLYMDSNGLKGALSESMGELTALTILCTPAFPHCPLSCLLTA